MSQLRQSVVRFVPLGLLLTFIAVHGAKVIWSDEDAQRGSAFAMFAGVDVGTTRRVEATVPGDPSILLEIPKSLGEERGHLADSPASEQAAELGQALLELTWSVDGDTAEVGGSARFAVVEVSVLALRADGRTLTTTVLTSVTVTGDK